MNISRSHFFTLVANLYFISYSTPHVVRIMVWILTFGVFDISHVSCEVFFYITLLASSAVCTQYCIWVCEILICLSNTCILPSVLWCCWLGGKKGILPVKKQSGGVLVWFVCLEQGAYLHMAQLMPLPLTVSCFSKVQIGFTFLVLADLGSPGKRALKRVWWWWWWLSSTCILLCGDKCLTWCEELTRVGWCCSLQLLRWLMVVAMLLQLVIGQENHSSLSAKGELIMCYVCWIYCLQFFDAVGWEAGRAPGL